MCLIKLGTEIPFRTFVKDWIGQLIDQARGQEQLSYYFLRHAVKIMMSQLCFFIQMTIDSLF